MEITDTFVRYIGNLNYERVPDEIRRIARRALIDTIGCAIAGSVEPAAKIAREVGAADGGNARATVIGGSGLKLSARDAAMINAIAGHALDYDDVNPMGHPSVPVAFTALAAAEDAGVSGRDLLTAYVVGVEVETKLMRAFSEAHYLLGWHSTSTLGVLGAAAAAAKIYKLDSRQIANTLGIAASQASGLRQNFGTMTKPFHPGHAAWSGITAAKLARAGFTADEKILEAPLGYLAVFASGPYDPARAIEKMDDFALMRPGLSVKKYPCCYCTHASIDGALAFASRNRISASDVVSIQAELSKFFLSPLIHHRPKTGLEGKFSLEYALSAALIDRKVVLATFTDPMVNRQEARSLVERVKMGVHEMPVEEGPRATFARLTFTMKDGRTIKEEVIEPRGAPANPLSDEEIADKFRDCFGFAGKVSSTCDRALSILWKIDELKEVSGLSSALI